MRIRFLFPLCILVTWMLFSFPGTGTALAQTCTSSQKADVLLLMDQSGSIHNDKAWDAAIANLVTTFQSKLRFGLMTYNSVGVLQVRIADNTATQINQFLASSKPKGPTRMRKAFQDATAYWKTHIASDPVKKRPRYIFLMTDGGSNDGSPTPEIQALRKLLVAGGTYDVQTFAIGFGNTITQAELDGYARPGGTTTGYHATNPSALNAALTKAAQQATQEKCDGIDNDCDGKIDEDGVCNKPVCTDGQTQACYSGAAGTKGVGLCKGGTQTCTKGQWGTCVGEVKPTAELCDGKDNNCDGKTDESFPTLQSPCTAGKGVCIRSGVTICKPDKTGVQCSAIPGQPTSNTDGCDGKDNDCDGQVDEDCTKSCRDGETRSCYAGPAGTSGVGLCKAGNQTCASGKWGACTGQVIPSPELCDGKDNDCNGRVDDNLQRACRTACGVGNETCQGGKWVNCTARKPSSTEICGNKIDDNCNGQIDENCTDCKPGEKVSCYTGSAGTLGKGICKAGTRTCPASGSWAGVACVGEVKPTAETCDNKDNDCDGSVDEGVSRKCSSSCGDGVELCRAGKWEACTAPKASAEVCDGKDNDCNGKIDDVPGGCGTCSDGQARPCYPAGQKGCTRQSNGSFSCLGACKSGTELCIGRKWSGICQGASLPTKEDCTNNKDDDCDGKVDCDCKDGETRACQTSCGKGTQTCKNNQWGVCAGAQPSPEICDGKDNDCDGLTDENLTKVCKNNCGTGISRCINGKQSTCLTRTPQPEICDGLDNDCDGKVDNGAQCPGGVQCTDGFCPSLCRNDECPTNQVCKGGYCYPKVSCSSIQCPKNQLCQKGTCVDVCSVLTCPKGLACWQGQCTPTDCYNFGCSKGQYCKQGVCVVNPCASLQCSKGSFCKNGQCVPLCPTCKSGTKCVDGKCVVDPCAGKTCPQGQQCYKGACLKNPCDSMQCPYGRLCKWGECKDDPCKATRCPQGLSCRDGQCLDLCKGVQCNAPNACKDGKCVKKDCYNFPCTDGKVCLQGSCKPNPCASVSCAKNAFCRPGKDGSGECVASCSSVTCKEGERCRDGSCEPDPCASITCNGIQICIAGKCVDNPCAKIHNCKGQVCNKKDGSCVDDPCKVIQCPAGDTCQEGQCIDGCKSLRCPGELVCHRGSCVVNSCNYRGCPDGQLCKNSTCVADKCATKTCKGNTFCREGQCFKSCADVQCGKGTLCEDGQCIKNPCDGVNCPQGQVCNKGKCQKDLCENTTLLCPPTQQCDPLSGKCKDEPCNGIRCPENQTCFQGQCRNISSQTPNGEKDTKDGGTNGDGGNADGAYPPGCTCQQGELPGTGSFFLFLLVGFLLTRRPSKKKELPF